MIRVSIPRYKLIEPENSKKFYVYIVEVTYGCISHTLEKRYSAFHRLYKELQKQYTTGDFPPKKLRNTAQKILDVRRAGLESWLQSVVQMPVLPAYVKNFLQIPNHSSDREKMNDTSSPLHRPILSFLYDPYLEMDDACILKDGFSNNVTLTNSVVKGVMTALYDTNFNVM